MADKVEKQSELMDWYGKLPTRRVDLVGDYAGQELFIVEGDGLLLRCFDDPKLDLVGMSSVLYRHMNYSVAEISRAGCVSSVADSFQTASNYCTLLTPWSNSYKA